LIIDTLKISLANHVECWLTVQGYHWNVTGEQFPMFHKMFGEVYEFYLDQVDPIGEHIRKITENAEFVNPAMDVLQKNKTISGELVVGDPIEMCKEILKLNNLMLTEYRKISEEALKEDLIELADYAAGITNQLKGLNWAILSITRK
jgi:DNA-binding ferritin-like protein